MAKSLPPPEKGNKRALTHGAYATIDRQRLDAKVAEVFTALAADAPVREADGGLPAADTVAVRMTAETLCRLENVREWIEQEGIFDERRKKKAKSPKNRRGRPSTRRSSNPFRALEMEDRLMRRLMDQLDSLGMTPRSRAKLGLDQARSFDLAREWEKQDAERKRDSIEGEGRES